MEDNKFEISAKGLDGLLVKSLENFQEERDLALERYRRQDEAMVDNEDFVLQGKTAVDYLKTAADRSNAIFSVAKLVKDILHKDVGNQSSSASGGGSFDDDKKKQILKIIRENDV